MCLKPENTRSTDAEDRLAARLYREAIIESLQAQVAQLMDDLQAAESARAEAERERDEAVLEAERLQDLEKTVEGVVKEVRRVQADCEKRSATTENRNVALFVRSKASAFGFTADWLEAALGYAEIEHSLTADLDSAASPEDS